MNESPYHLVEGLLGKRTFDYGTRFGLEYVGCIAAGFGRYNRKAVGEGFE